MKKLYFLVAVLFVVGSVRGQNPDDIINFPDPNFKNKLLFAHSGNIIAKNLEGNYFSIDGNNNNEIEISEALQVSSLVVVPSPTIVSLEGIQYFTNLKHLNCNGNNIPSLDVSSLVQLETLLCAAQLTSLNVSGLVNLKLLVCGGSALTSLDISSLINLEKLNIHLNNLTTLDLSNQPLLNTLTCSENQLNTLDLSNQPLLNYLSCNSNPNISFIGLNNLVNLEQLYLNSCGLSTLDISNLSNLKNFECKDNDLTSLDLTGLSNLEIADCSFNQLTELNLTGLSSLNTLWCQYNELADVDFSGAPLLSFLHCSDNQFQNLDFSSLIHLEGYNMMYNPLLTLNLKSGRVWNDSDSNFRFITTLQHLCVDEYYINQAQYFADQTGNNCVINDYCSFTPGGDFYTISGASTVDSNDNGCDASDATLPYLQLNITDGSQTGTVTANQSGQYSIPVYGGTHTITPVLENTTYFNISPATAEVTFPETTSPFTQNFCITPNGLHPDLEVAILPTTPARPGFNANYKLIIKNKGNIQQSGSVSFAYDDTVLDYIIAAPLFTTQAEGSLSWAFADLQPFETREINVTLNLNSSMETPAVNGDDVLTYTATITSEATDELPLDNTFTLPQIVVNSFDPNDKTCLEGTAITPDMIGKYVHYMIRFENTGTFAAENIVVKDMIDTEKFDVSSLVALNGSHPYVTRITGNKVEFIFEGINLPFDDANNDGYVVFKIKTLPTLALGDSFSNTASIYFDFNHPIVTEPAVTTFADLDTKDFEFNNYFTIYPNPTNGILNITSKQAIELQSISIYNVLGQMVVAVPNAKGISTVDVSSLSTGNYFIKVVSDKGTSNSKFIKK